MVLDLSDGQKRILVEKMAETIAGTVLDGISHPDPAEREKYSAWKALIDANYHGDVGTFLEEMGGVFLMLHPHLDAALQAPATMSQIIECICRVVTIVWERLLARENLKA